MAVPSNSTLRRTARYAFLLSLTLVLGIGLYLTFLDTGTSLIIKLSGLGVNLIASGFFAVVFTYLSDRENQQVVSSEIQSAFAEHSKRMIEEWQKQVAFFVPAGQFVPTKGFDPGFNGRLMDELRSASYYCFRGVTAKYVAVRLAALATCPSHVTVILPDPSSQSAMRRRVADRSQNPKYGHKNPTALLEDMQKELKESVVALFDQRFASSISLAFSSETFVTRAEITDQTCFVALYFSSNSRGQSFPETLEFDAGSFYYQVQRLDSDRRVELAETLVRFDYTTSESELLAEMSRLFGSEFDSEDLSLLRQRYAARMKNFTTFLGDLNTSNGESDA